MAKAESTWNFWVQSRAKVHGVPLDLAKAIIKVESGWKVDAKGDYWRDSWSVFKTPHSFGLMQVRISTAREISGLGKKLTPEMLLKPKININLGIQYLAKQKRRFGTWEKAVAAYNAGSPRMKGGSFVNQGYVDKVNEAYKGYTGRYLYTPLRKGSVPLRFLLLASLGLFFLTRKK